MPSAPLPPNEQERLAALKDLEVLDTAAEPQFNAMVEAAAAVTRAPIALVSLVDEDRQWFKAAIGLGSVRQTDRCDAFCAHSILTPDPMQVEDAELDERFASNPLVVGDPKIRFYYGAPITLSSGFRVGTLCVIDRVPRTLSEVESSTLQHLAAAAASAFEGRKSALELARRTRALTSTQDELEEANKALRHANEDLNSFVQVASHDLKSPLLTIARLTDWAMEALEERELTAAREHLELVVKRVTRMETLLADLLAFATLGRRAARTESIDLWTLVERAFHWHEGSQGVQLILSGERSEITTQVAPLEVVLRNLIGNGVKHGEGPEPIIEVSTEADTAKGWVSFQVRDNGPGIEPQYQESIFEPFRMLQSRDKREGSGLGLSIVKRTVEQAGGTISLDSDGVSGTIFSLAWPIDSPEG